MKKLTHWVVLFFVFAGVIPSSGFANENIVRWTAIEDQDGSVAHVISVLNQKLNLNLKEADFFVQDDRDLAFNHYKRLVLMVDSLPVHGKSIRIWTERDSTQVVQVEADIVMRPPMELTQLTLRRAKKSVHQLRAELSPESTMQLVRDSVLKDSDHSGDVNVRGLDSKDEWRDGIPVRVVKVRGKRGYHFVSIDLRTKEIMTREYREFPHADQIAGEFSIPVQVYPVYEEVEAEGTILPRVSAELKHVYTQIPQTSGDIYAPLKTQHYYDAKFDPVLGYFADARSQGYWSMNYLKSEAAKIRAALPFVDNDFAHGVLLQGRYATINIHPDALKAFGPLNFLTVSAAAFFPSWAEATLNGASVFEMTPSTALTGKPIMSAEEAWNRPARRLPNHNPTEYLNDGFDEIQVYYAIDTLFDTLQTRGFSDPEISTRPFNAFLFNPDISDRDNAFYTDDTINFTTYSPKAPNFARDNATIWHELGHGVMDRLMGDSIELADTGGLSEGMADFVAAMVVRGVTEGKPFPGSDKFRIINKMGFNLTNEVHDDGEAYGGAMKDFMDAVIEKNGQPGLAKVADVVLEAMRLTRDYPGLTAPEWFNHILFADSLGRPGVREAGELKPYLLAALAGRNFKFDATPVASFSIADASDGHEIVQGAAGSRVAPIIVPIPKDGTAKFTLRAGVKNSDSFQFKFPLQVRVQFNGGPLQGAVHWVGEENGTRTYALNSESDSVTIPLEASGSCDEVNRPDGSCVDYAYVQIWNAGETERPSAKKRFYLRIKNPSPETDIESE